MHNIGGTGVGIIYTLTRIISPQNAFVEELIREPGHNVQ